MMMRCPKCEKENNQGNQYCAYCGAKLFASDPFHALGDLSLSDDEVVEKGSGGGPSFEMEQAASADALCFTAMGDLDAGDTPLTGVEHSHGMETAVSEERIEQVRIAALGGLTDASEEKTVVPERDRKAHDDGVRETDHIDRSRIVDYDGGTGRGPAKRPNWKLWGALAASVVIIVAACLLWIFWDRSDDDPVTPSKPTQQGSQGDKQPPSETTGSTESSLSESCDFILSSGVDVNGNHYELVANQRESALGYEITVGIIKNNTWLYPLSKEFPFLDQEDNLFHVSVDLAGDSGHSLDYYHRIIDNIYFVDIGAFVMESYHETDSWWDNDEHTYIVFSCSAMDSYTIDCEEYNLEFLLSDTDRKIYTEDGKIVLWSEEVVDSGILTYDYFYDWCLLDMRTLELTTICSGIQDVCPESALSEGLIFASDKCFYNTQMQKVIDLSEYSIDMFYDSGIYFRNGKCTFKAKNELKHEYEITIDIHGNVLSETLIG